MGVPCACLSLSTCVAISPFVCPSVSFHLSLGLSISVCLSVSMSVSKNTCFNCVWKVQRNCEAQQFSSCVFIAVLGLPYAPLWLARTDLREACATGGLVLLHSAAPTAQAEHRGQEGLVEWELQAPKTPENTPLPQERASESGDWCKGLHHHRPPKWGRVEEHEGYKQKERQRFQSGHFLSIQSSISHGFRYSPWLDWCTTWVSLLNESFFLHFLPSVQTFCWNLSTSI